MSTAPCAITVRLDNLESETRQSPICLLFSGQIHNAQTLARRLQLPQQKNHPAQLIEQAYQHWGADFLLHLQGEFSLALYDANKHGLLLARDPIGVQPLFYSRQGTQIHISTSYASFHQLPWLDKRIDQPFLFDMLSMGTLCQHALSPNSYYQSVKRVMPGERLIITMHKTSRHKYWQLTKEENLYYAKRQDYEAEFSELLQNAISKRLPANAKVAVELSGGLDSAAVTSYTQAQLPQKLLALSNSLPNLASSNHTQVGELPYAQKIAHHLGIPLTTINSGFDFSATLMEFACHMPGTFGGVFAPLNYRCYEIAKANGADVILSGFGGDQVASQPAYLLFEELKQQKRWARYRLEKLALLRNPKAFKKIHQHYTAARSPQENNYHTLLLDIVKPEYTPILKSNIARLCAIRTVNDAEAAWIHGSRAGFIANRLESAAIISQLFNIRYSYPLLDIDLIRFCHRVPTEIKRQYGIGRRLMRAALRKKLPPCIANRHDKAGTTIPAASQAFAKYIEEQGWHQILFSSDTCQQFFKKPCTLKSSQLARQHSSLYNRLLLNLFAANIAYQQSQTAPQKRALSSALKI